MANEMHAWNIVTIAGKRYHLDITFGTGLYGSVTDSLNTFLMDDQRKKTNIIGSARQACPKAEALQ